MHEEASLVVIGGLNTDIVASGIRQFPKPGEHVYGKQLTIGPGGKSRNIAAMAGTLLPGGYVAMIGRTVQDKFGLWRPPLEALQAAGVTTEFVRVLRPGETDKLPAIALIPVNEAGENQIIVLPGVSDDFDPADIDAAQPLFDAAGKNQGFLALTLECPLETANYAVEKAIALGIKVLFDPGGIESKEQAIDILKSGVFLIKPNEHEAKIITGVAVADFATAKQAAQILHRQGAEHVLITHGEQGAYLFSGDTELHIPIDRSITGDIKDATGCGDQTMATLCAYLQNGSSLETAARAAVISGTLQFHKTGIQPVTKTELEGSL